MAEKKVKQVCKCENCGNEAEMVVTCQLPDADHPAETSAAPTEAAAPVEGKSLHRARGTATCQSCGNEADMWVDLE
jgi:DNA-directed RNA polymerase subunit M/transcription elongation factor TFIIS